MYRPHLKLKCGQTRCTLLTFLPATSLQIVVKMLAVLQNHWRIQYNSVSQCCGISLNCTNSESTLVSLLTSLLALAVGHTHVQWFQWHLELPRHELNALCNHRLPPNSLYDTASYKKWNISKDISKLVSDEKKWGKHEYLGKGMCSLIRQLCSNFKLFEKNSSSLFGHSNFGPGQIFTP